MAGFVMGAPFDNGMGAPFDSGERVIYKFAMARFLGREKWQCTCLRG